MRITHEWRIAALTFALALATLTGAAVRASEATARQDTHHSGTPAAGDVCDLAATPAGGMPGMGTAMPGMGMGQGTPMPGMMQEFDLMFIDMMIPHHESAVAMAQVALDRAEHDEIRALAEDIIASQSAEIEQMREWREAWYPGAPQMPMDQMMDQMMEMMQGMPGLEDMDMMGMMGMAMDQAAEVAALCAAPEPFDQAFIDAMIPHHQSAVAMAEVARQNASQPEIVQLADAIIEAQQREIAQMEEWREAWYGLSPTASPASSSLTEEVAVTLTEFKVEASRTDFRVGETYRFVVTNGGAVAHEFMILPRVERAGQMDMDELDRIALAMIPASELTPGTTRTVDVTFPEAAATGSLEFACTEAGHYIAGMVLPITVSE